MVSDRVAVLSSHVAPQASSSAQTNANGIQVTICGGGNAAHVMVCDFTLKGYTVNLYAPYADEAKQFKKNMPAEGILINYRATGRSARARPQRVSKHAEDVIPGSKFIFIPLPVFAHEGTLLDIVPHCDEDACIVALPATGAFDWCAESVFKKLGKRVTVAGISPLPYVCRTAKYAQEVNLLGQKHNVLMATLPGPKVHELAPIIDHMIGSHIERAPTFLPITLIPTNPIMHTGRCYGLFVASGYWRERKGYPRMVLFYEECDDVSDRVLIQLDDENQKIVKALDEVIPGSTGGKVLKLNQYLKWTTPEIEKWDTPADTFRTNPQFKGVGSPMRMVAPDYWVPNFESRYFTEDIPFGLLTNKGLAELLGVETPMMDTILEWCQKEMGKKWLVNGRVNPSERPQMTPQAFGLTLTGLKELYRHR
ncbi:Tauropine dehydrogenase [Diplonema papillatum]|nr:Tauropine dehydrogenase [Diplonema papillatum]|eukprot:gene18474-28511_t